MTLEPVAAVRPVAPYIGGKRNLSKLLVERINAVPHALYAEPFVGMGGVFFKRLWRIHPKLVEHRGSKRARPVTSSGAAKTG